VNEEFSRSGELFSLSLYLLVAHVNPQATATAAHPAAKIKGARISTRRVSLRVAQKESQRERIHARVPPPNLQG